MKGIVWFDCDGVLTNYHSSWMYLHEYFGSRDNSFFADLYRRGLITYLDWMKIDVALMINSYGKPITRMDVEKALDNIRIRDDAPELTRWLKSKGFVVGVISSGVDMLVKKVCKAVDADICLYNELLFIDDILIPGGVDRVPLLEKPRIIREYSMKQGFQDKDLIYVGDSAWDIEVFKEADLSIAVQPCGEACRYADYVVEKLSEIRGLISKHYGL